jgi:hypothetical protein
LPGSAARRTWRISSSSCASRSNQPSVATRTAPRTPGQDCACQSQGNASHAHDKPPFAAYRRAPRVRNRRSGPIGSSVSNTRRDRLTSTHHPYNEAIEWISAPAAARHIG